MKWSWKVGKVLGIDVFIHATFLILLGWVALAHYLREGTASAAVYGIIFTLAVFGTVVLHELGHALTARRFGIRTRDITLLPIGGIARLERMPEKPSEELLVALAGPAVNVAIAIVLFVGLTLTGRPILLDNAGFLAAGPFLTNLLWVNIVLAAFNLLPAFPMDGGRALRALLAMRTDYVRATQIAARLGQGIALALGVFGLFFNPFLAFVALFVWIGAAGESAAVQVKAALEGVPIRSAMLTDFRVLSPRDPLATAVQSLLAGSQIDFPVLDDDGSLAGMLTRTDLIRALAAGGKETLVGAAMQRRFEMADPSEMLDSVLARLQASGCQSMPVVRQGRIVGVVTIDNVGELMMVQTALRSASPPPSGGRRPRAAGGGAPNGALTITST